MIKLYGDIRIIIFLCHCKITHKRTVSEFRARHTTATASITYYINDTVSIHMVEMQLRHEMPFIYNGQIFVVGNDIVSSNLWHNRSRKSAEEPKANYRSV